MLPSEGITTDKLETGLLQKYSTFFGEWVNRPVTIVEIGILRGGSLRYWDSYFRHPESRVFGVDKVLPTDAFPPRIVMHQCDQNDRGRLVEIADAIGPIDIVIDDGSHRAAETRNTFEAFYPHVVPDGYYAIEDFAVSYWTHHPEFVGTTDLVNDIIRNVPALRIASYSVTVDRNALAIFRKAVPGVPSIPRPDGTDDATALSIGSLLARKD